jgi:hypothetical protein
MNKKLKIGIIVFASVIGLILFITFISFGSEIFQLLMLEKNWAYGRTDCNLFAKTDYSLNHVNIHINDEKCKILNGNNIVFFKMTINSDEPKIWNLNEMYIDGASDIYFDVFPLVDILSRDEEINSSKTINLYAIVNNSNFLELKNSGVRDKLYNFEASFYGRPLFHKNEITSICTYGNCTGFECVMDNSSLWTCQYYFQINLTRVALQRFQNILIEKENPHNAYYESHVIYYVNNETYSEWRIPTSYIGVSLSKLEIYVLGSKNATSEEEAKRKAYLDMYSLENFLDVNQYFTR